MMAAVAAVLTACQIAPQSPSIGTTPADKASPGYRKQAAQHLYTQLRPHLPGHAAAHAVCDRRAPTRRPGPREKPALDAQAKPCPPVWPRSSEPRSAAPFPAPGRSVTYTDTWLWDKSGRFQLDTLTEGQLGQ
jgi:hypothetical protein